MNTYNSICNIKRRGFALISTIIVMSLLMIVAVASLSISSLETRTSGVISGKLEAQLNARLALIEAISELQSSAGPDQRITITADMAGLEDGSELAAGSAPENDDSHDGTSKGLSMVQNGTRYWTGVYANREIDPEDSIYTKTPTSEHLAWLVSGINPNPGDAQHSLSATGEPQDVTNTVVLVGEYSVGEATGDNVENFVSAPLVDLSKNGSVTGRYAWWVGDEGVKARTNQRADYAENDEAEYEDLVANRTSWETVDGFEDYPKPGNDGDLDKIIGDGELELVEGSLRGDPLEKIFHSGTPYSLGLATNTLAGGLKVDLSYYIENGFPSSATFAGEPVEGENIIPDTVSSTIQGPKWKQVADFSQVGKEAATGSGELLVQVAGASGSDTNITPIITDIRALFGAKTELIDSDGDKFRVYAAAKIAVSISNPYPYPLRWASKLEFELTSDTPGGGGIHPSCIWELRNDCKYLPQNSSTPACLHNAIMLIPTGVLAPGESRAYTIGSEVERPWGTATVNIDLVPVSGAGVDPSNFEHAIIQKNNAEYTGTKRLDVRESRVTTQMTAELRLSGTSSSSFLSRIKSFELDNGFFNATTRYVDKEQAKDITKPFGLQLFTFQISQPAADYASVLPDPSLMGIAGSTLRTFADYNVRAVNFKAPITSFNPPPFFSKSENSLAGMPYDAPGGRTGTAFTQNMILDPLPWGHSAFGPEKTVLFSFPEKVLSLGQFQHVDLTADDQNISIADQPGSAFANSYAPPTVKRHLSSESRTDYALTSHSGSTKTLANYYDISYLLNASIWDKYFLSTIPKGGSEPENLNMVAFSTANTVDLQKPQLVAANLGVKGAFNVNSTNKDAWIALLSSTRYLQLAADGGVNKSGAFFPRSLEQVSGAAATPSGDEEDSWSGYRRLSDDEVESLAEHIVKQVRSRGPFTSLAHFTNRTLVGLTEDAELGRSGLLQAAIDNAGLTVSPDRTKTAFENLDMQEDKVTFQHDGDYPAADMAGTRATKPALLNSSEDFVWARVSKDLNAGSVASIISDKEMLTDDEYKDEQGSRSTGIPGWLTQADVLQAIGPSITVRSDTFRVRAYGESVDPVTGVVKARAWCEAIVQRTPEYVDPINTPEVEVDLLTETNKKFGRKFNVTSFRWLHENEI